MERNTRHTLESPALTAIGINYFGTYRNLRPDPCLTPHSHTATEICYLEKGSQTYTVGGVDYEISGEEVFIAFPGELHSTGGSFQARGRLYWIQLDADCPSLLGLDAAGAELIGGCLKALCLRRFRISAETGKLLISAYNDLASESPLRSVTARSKLVLFVCGLVSDMANYGRGDSPSPEIAACLEFIDSHIKDALNPAYLAETLNFSESYFKLKFKREVGIPPRDYILRRRVELSKAELAEGQKNVTDVALEFGFSSSQHYARVFRDVTGTTPTEYIEKVKCGGGTR